MDRRALNRATLFRQSLLERRTDDVIDMVEMLGGLNAQHPNDPYLALHSRLDGFKLAALTEALEQASIVRSCLMRATQHLVSAADFTVWRPVLGPMLERLRRNAFGRRTETVDLTKLVAQAREALDGRTMTRPELGRLLAAEWPGVEASALAWSVQYLLPLVHPAPSGTWDHRGAIPMRLAPTAGPDPQGMVRRYLAAFGPARIADMRAWSGIAGLREIVAGMRTELVELKDGLFDLPDAPLPDPDAPAPVRLVAGFDNLLLAFADRRRIMTDEVRARVCVGDLIEATLLVDGMVCGTWEMDRAAGLVTVKPFARLRKADKDAAVSEGHRMLALAAPGSQQSEVRVLASDP